MKIIINNSSMIPIYEQIVEQVKHMILEGDLPEHTVLPSVRGLSKELKISALTVKKAYDLLEAEGLTVTVHGKGTYVAQIQKARMLEEHKKMLERELEMTLQKAKNLGLEKQEVVDLFHLIMEEWQ